MFDDLIINDTINEKAFPLSNAQNTIEGCSFHTSHLKRKTVYGYQFLELKL